MLAIVFLSVYLISTTELPQLLKLPILVEHYFEHIHKTPNLTVVEFLTLHYKGDHLANHPHDDDYDHDRQLPFMRHGSSLNIVCITPDLIRMDIGSGVGADDSDEIRCSDELFVDRISLSSIWQPPQSC